MARRRAGTGSAMGVNADARGAIQAARKGKCKLAFRHLKDAAPHHQTEPGSPRWEKAIRDHQLATVIYDRLCTTGKAGRPLYGAKKKRRRARRRR